MKAIKTLSLFVFSLLVASCFDAPDFNDTPEIAFQEIYFSKTPTGNDSLVLTFTFKDGNGDVGLGPEPEFPEDGQDPFHDFTYYINDGTKIIDSVKSIRLNDEISYLDVPERLIQGKLTRYGDVPLPYPYDCENFPSTSVYILSTHDFLFDASFRPYLDSTTIGSLKFYIVTTELHARLNPRYNNFKVSFFYMKNPYLAGAEWKEYSFENCASYNGRFKRLSKKNTPLSGTITYTMTSLEGLSTLLGPKAEDVVWQLRFSILDRNGNESNTAETIAFRLPEITR